MKYITKIRTATLSVMMACIATTGCSLLDEDIDDTLAQGDSVKDDFAFSLNSVSQPTRLSAEVVQATEGSFNGLAEIHIYPYIKQGKVTSDDHPRLFDIHTFGRMVTAPNAKYYYYENQTFMDGVGAILAYARGAHAETLSASATDAQQIEYKAKYGSLVHKPFALEMLPTDINFSLEPIYPDDDAPDAATTLAAYMTYIANAKVTYAPDPSAPEDTCTVEWATTRQSQLRVLYYNFINLVDPTTATAMAGSAANVKIHVDSLYHAVYDAFDAISDDPLWAVTQDDMELRQEILSRIKNPKASVIDGLTFDATNQKITSFGSAAIDNYPRNLGLPDGAAVVQWNTTAERFDVQMHTTALADINSMSRFAYPAALYYYANSQIKTSMLDNREDYYPSVSSSETWSEMLDHYELNKSTVVPHTKAVAMIDPLQYAVAHLVVKLNPVATDKLKDADGKQVSILSAEKNYFPMRSIIVGGQRPVDFNFLPEESDVNLSFVYDRSVADDIFMTTSTVAE